ncbi:MAG: hypothetical protein JOZ95_19120 [Solirubrobacterales bacterium]|nr:hypothetical protein [Solirubrobacterales bacterium]MBV8991185.1 hypothetical protein [Solirubrobacterales bacterium]
MTVRQAEQSRRHPSASRGTTPLLITDLEQQQFWPGQARQALRPPPRTKQLIGFATAEGAGRHCEPLASALRETRVYDWLDQYLSGTPPAPRRNRFEPSMLV